MSNIVAKCSQVKGKNLWHNHQLSPSPDSYSEHTSSDVFWRLYTLDGIEVCEIETDGLNKYFLLELGSQNLYYIYPGIKLKLVVKGLGGPTRTSDIYIEYNPDSELTAYFEFKGTESNVQLYYRGTQ